MGEKKDKQTFNTRLYECCGTDDLRPLLQCVHFSNGFAYAANGYMAVKQTISFQGVVAPEKLEGKFLHRDSFKAAMGYEIAEVTDDGIDCRNTNGGEAFFPFYEKKEADTVPQFEAVLKPKKGQIQLGFIGIDPDMLMRLSKALHVPDGSTIRLQFTGVDSHIIIDVPGVDEQIAVLMPRIINDTLF